MKNTETSEEWKRKKNTQVPSKMLADNEKSK